MGGAAGSAEAPLLPGGRMPGILMPGVLMPGVLMPGVLLSAMLLAACAGPGGMDAGAGPAAGAQASTGSLVDRMNSMLFGPPARPGEGSRPAPAADSAFECPPVTVRRGTGTITTYGRGDQAATNVSYQVSFGQMARQCAALGPTVSAKVGVEGRIVLGPAGAPGRITVPIRFALVREGPQPQTLWTQLYQVPVDIGSGQMHIPFVHIDNNIVFPRPSAADEDALIFYVGFDQLASRERPRGRR